MNEKSQRSLSSGGRTVKEESSHGGLYTYGYDNSGNLNSLGEQGKKQAKVEYNPDGSTRSVTDRLGNVTTFEYDERGLLIKEKSPSATTVYEYDNVGRIKTVLVGSGSNLTKANSTQYVEYEYSDAGRKVKVIYGRLYETSYELNAWGEVTTVTDGMGNSRKYEYDSIGRTIALYDAYGAKAEYSYNAVGRVSSVTAPNGTKKTYEYNELYLVTKAEDGEGIFFEGKYNRDGLLIAEKSRPGVDKEYSYDKLGRIVEVKTGGDVTERYSYTAKGRTVTFTDGKGSDYAYSFDEFGRLTQEKNRLDGVQSYTYNENGELKTKKDFEGNMTAVSYDTKTRTRRTSYADGTEAVTVYDECGNILSATNESGTLSYIYDKAGLLTKETDEKTGESVSYFYDKAGRRTRLVSRERDISYGYGKNSELLSQKDRLKQLEIHYKYDACGREIERRFGNGVRQLTFYDKAGRTICIRQVNSSDRLLSGEAYAYDKLGRRSMTVNEKGLVTIYKYDNQSRLETVYYPFNEDIKETARKEADKQGLYFQPSQGTAENYFLSTGELLQLKAVAECIASGRSGAITVNQVVWKESYTYDPNGNRTSKTTSWGTVQYAYDKENRLTESGNLGMSESVKYTYDANGNLLRESAARYRKDYTYNAQNRMCFSDVQDSVLNTRNFTEYAYDAFGRRIETRQYLGDYTRNLYDGFSFDVLGKSVLQSAYSANIPAQKYRDGQSGHPELVSGSAQAGRNSTSSGRNAAGTDIGTRYRYIEDNPLVPFEQAGSAGGAGSGVSASTTKTRSRPNNEYVLYSYGEPVGMTNDSGTSYFGTDILGSVRNVIDKSGTVQADYSYDAFGSPYLGNLENDIGFGYCGKVYDIGTGLYDYGFRDYSPNNARFTTIDPIRDGSNWFAYVVNDPVNYVDPLGLKTFEEIKEKAKTIVNDFVYGKQETIEVDGQKITVQKSSPLLKTMTFLRDVASIGLIAAGNPLGALLALIPTGRVDNQTGDYLAFAGEHSVLGQAYLDKGVTYVFKDTVVTRGMNGLTVKMPSIGDVIVRQSEIIFSPATTLLNGGINGLKTFLSEPEPSLGSWVNTNIVTPLLGHPPTTEQYNIYKNQDVLNNSVTDRNGNAIDLHGLSGNLNVFDGNISSNDKTNYSNPGYLLGNITFKNITFNSSGNAYIGFDSFSKGCTK